MRSSPQANIGTATKADVEAHFNTHGTGEITEIKLMNGFGFIEYKDAMDARDVVPGELCCDHQRAYSNLSSSQPSTVRISWVNVSLFNSPVAPAIVMHLPLRSVLLLAPDVLPIACRSLDFQVRPAGRSVIPVPSPGLLDLRTCYLDSEQHIWTPSLLSNPFLGTLLFSPGQHHALLWITVSIAVC